MRSCSGDVHFPRVHVIVLVVDVVCLTLVLSARVIVHAVVIAFPEPVFCIRRYTLYSFTSARSWNLTTRPNASFPRRTRKN